jgi:hypothetical protein
MGRGGADAHGNRAQPPRALGREPQHQPRGRRYHQDGHTERHHVQPVRGLRAQKEGRRDGPGAGEHRDGQGRDGDVGLGQAGVGFLLRFLDARALRPEHVQRDEQQHDAGRHLKGRHGDAENAEDPLAHQGKHQQHAGHDRRGQQRHAPPVRHPQAAVQIARMGFAAESVFGLRSFRRACYTRPQ